MSSAEQDQWVDICDMVRAGLAKRVEMIPAMTPDEVASLVNCIDAAMTNATNARTHDKTVRARKKELERQITFGGQP